MAQPGAWTWGWKPLPGVWLVLVLLAVAYGRILRSVDLHGEPFHVRRRRLFAFGAAVFLLWASLDWPLGPLGASYFASVHMSQFLAVGVAAPALLLLSLPHAAFARLKERPRIHAFLEGVTHPVSAFFVFNIVMTVSHWPGVVDTLMPTQSGSFLLDATWLAAGLVFWWPLVAPVPDRSRFHPLAKIGYLALNAFLIRPPFAMMIFSEHPIYAIYELAGPPAGDAMEDQQLAGAIMKIGVAWIMFVAVVVVFFDWKRREDERAAAAP